MTNTDTASPSFWTDLGRLTKFGRILGLDLDDMQVVINDPEIAEKLKSDIYDVIYTPEVRLIRALFPTNNLSVIELHRLAGWIDIPRLLRIPDSPRYRQVIDLLYGFSGSPMHPRGGMSRARVEQTLCLLWEGESVQMEFEALEAMRHFLRRIGYRWRDEDGAKVKVPVGA